MDNMTKLQEIRKQLQEAAEARDAMPVFFKTGPGHYAEHDKFIGVDVPTLRKIAVQFKGLSIKEIKNLLESEINEERLLALFMLIEHYKKGSEEEKDKIFQFILDHLQHVNNWNLVDAFAPYIIGPHLENKDKKLLINWAHSEGLWEKRIAIVATHHYIRNDQLEWTFKIAKILLKDNHDLIHKAVGWMLREAGKRDQQQLVNFLEEHGHEMPRTMLRYAIEKFSDDIRKQYLAKFRNGN